MAGPGDGRRHSHERRSMSIDILRSELDNLEEAETVVPVRLSQGSFSNDTHEPNDTTHVNIERTTRPSSPRVSTTSTRRGEAGHVTFSENRHHLRLDTNLYPIQSRVDDTEAARQWREAHEQRHGPNAEGSERVEGDNSRLSRVSFVEPPSITRPGHRRLQFGGIEDSIKRAAQASTTIANAKDWAAKQKARTKRLKRARTGRLRTKAAELYKQWILEGLLRQKPLPPSVDGRHIPITPGLSRRKDGLTDERRGSPYIPNFIRSSRYTVWSFLPKQLFFQFSKLANAYFLTIGILQMIPGLSTTGTYTTIGPLIAFVGLSMAKEGWDDYRRYKMDKLENKTETWVLDPDGVVQSDKQHGRFRVNGRANFRKTRADVGGEMQDLDGAIERKDESPPWSQDEEVRWSKMQWQELRVGDIIKLQRDDNVPADIILLHATGPNGIAYIETMALDGETNLKSKQACPLFTEHCNSLSALQSCDAEIVSEDPNLDLYNYEGKAIVNGKAMPLTLNQVVYRGSILRNTNEAVGVVINSGEECKIRMNASKNVHAKAPAMQAKVNKIVIILVFFVILLSFGCSIGNVIWVDKTEHIAWYLNSYVVSFGHILIAFVIAFNTLIPLSLYVSLEIVKIGQVMLLRDVDMYDPASNTPMGANTTTILENLGQVSYVFSDKTGTLTENLMRFRKMSVAGTAWLHDMDLHGNEAQKRHQVNPTDYKGKQVDRASTSTVMDNRTSITSMPRRSDSVWTTHSHSNSPQPQLKTDELLRYVSHRPNTHFSERVRQFLLCIALCHTCLPEKKADGNIVFQAASPDELALVEAAQDLGILLVDRSAQIITLLFKSEDQASVEEKYEVLDVIEFSSKRKRMSIIIRMPDGKISVFTKGADSVILPRLNNSKLAMETATAVDRQASIRKSMEQHHALRKFSVHSTRNSTGVARATSNVGHRVGIFGRKSSGNRSGSMARTSRLTEDMDPRTSIRGRNSTASGHGNDQLYGTPRPSRSRPLSMDLLTSPVAIQDPYDVMVDESLALSDSAVFERCFQHIDDFASEGLRTLLYAYRIVEENEYSQWKTVYHEATTSLTNRQERIEAAADIIEQGFELAGATAIEDKLQHGVPDTIDKLRRANIKVWMLTGDKRETAINIAHSAGICKPFSEIYILDAMAEGVLSEKIAATLVDVGRGMVPHSVVVIDGHTLGEVEQVDELKILFFDLVARVDSVICCRASPAQKATLVKCIRDRVPSSLTLAIGDGANDIAMIQSSHVGIGISGREGLQAARISDYSIAQFRFLQKLLFVHGRWNYIRTGKYILGTFWKELFFYLMQALYQRYNGYTGTSLYESASLAVFNTLFTSLCVIIPGIFEQDLRAETLLAVPELYVYGQKSKAFNFRKYLGWSLMAVVEAVLVYFAIWGIFTQIHFDLDDGLFAMGDLAFSAGVLLINIKLLILELHNKTLVTFVGFLLSIGGWFLWNLILAAAYEPRIGPYTVHGAFIHRFGKSPLWWLTLIMVLIMVILLELAVTAVRRVFWPQDQDLMQEMEKRLGVLSLSSADDAELGDAYAENHERTDNWRWVVPNGFRRWGRRRPSKNISGDVYMAPPFVATPRDEQLTDPMDGTSPQGTKDGKKGTTTTVTPIKPEESDAWTGEIMSGAAASGSGSRSAFVHNPIELQSPHDKNGSAS
ncbi:drs2 neo1 protein [Gnomoniopsis smithogilvyi]|uniref:Phospholipid-transporting ATPase n=1 Tax=Gnomoniopsis smithogilvyi TaxID=1191159 RepID=A0A9W9CW38_9PEZI|nr:drs2 neo1 protein [Gnomoniopsis smithogilvyi]